MPRNDSLPVLAILLIFICTPFAHAADKTANVTVDVTGAGASYDEAKADAIKKALQLALKQLVIVDRVISEDEVLRDRVLSTSNGYVEDFREKSTAKTEYGYTVDAEITVSATRIENFLGVVNVGGGEISGSLIDQEMQRRLAQDSALKSQAQARQEIFERLFENYPMSAVELKLNKISISPKNPNILLLDIEQSYKPSFVAMLEESFRALSIHECEFELTNKKGSFFGMLRNKTLCPYKDQESQKTLISQHLPPSFTEDPVFSQVCIGYEQDNKAKCFLLDQGARLTNKSVANARFQIVGAFIDANGKNVLNHGQCVHIGESGGSKFQRTLGIVLETRLVSSLKISAGHVKLWSGFHLSTEKLTFQVEMDASVVDLKQANHLIAVAGMTTKKGNFVGLTSASDQSMSPCDAVDDAIRYHMLSVTADGQSNDSGRPVVGLLQ